MTRGDFYRVARPTTREPKKFRVFLVVSRQTVIDSRFATVVCAPVYSARHGLSSQVDVGPDEGLKHESCVHCDELISLSKPVLTQFVGRLAQARIPELDLALAVALGIDPDHLRTEQA